MRINGNYLDRFVFSILIYTVPITAFIILLKSYSQENVSWKPFVILMLLFSIFIWLIDTMVCHYRFHPKEAVLKNREFFLKNQRVPPNQIKSIIPITISLSKWNYEVVQITIGKDKFYWLEKPKSILQFFNDESPSIKKLLSEIPELKDNVLPHKIIWKFKDL